MTETDDSIIGGRLLFVDDETNILRALRRIFMDDEFEVYTAASGQEALDLLREQGEMGVIVSDQRMPEMSGVDFLEKSKQISPNSVRILLTGYADINAAVDAINRGGAFRYLHKPWQDDELHQAVQSAFKYYNLIKENKRLTALVVQQNKQLKNWNSELEAKVKEQTVRLTENNAALKKLNKKLYKNFKSTIRAFSSLLEMRDKSMRSHSHNIAEVLLAVAAELDMPGRESDALVAAAFLHDIGKIGIADHLLHRDEAHMNQAQRLEYRKHPVRGQTVVDGIDELRQAGALIRHHHERYDGMGFPDGLKKNAIPTGARLIAIADFFDKKFREQHDSKAVANVCRLVEEEAGRAFDPRLVPKVLKVAEKFYATKLSTREATELELKPGELKEGMVVSRDVISGTGVLLLGIGTELNSKNIDTLKRYYRVDPAKTGVFISIG